METEENTISPVTVSSRGKTEVDMAKANEEKIKRLEESVRDLLDLCARNELSVPGEVTKSLANVIEGNEEDHNVSCSEMTYNDFLISKVLCQRTFEDLDFKSQLAEIQKRLKLQLPSVELKIKDGSYSVFNHQESPDSSTQNGESDEMETGPRRAKQKIDTVGSASPLYKLYVLLKKCIANKGKISCIKTEKKLIDKVNLVFESGKMYLVLGSPGSGKSTLLKYIANTNPQGSTNNIVGGEICLSTVKPSKGIYWPKLVGYIDQIDRLFPLQTVFETCEFAWMCRSGGTHKMLQMTTGPDAEETIRCLDENLFVVNKCIDNLGLSNVRDTFIGDQATVRGVSGGQKKRVTVAEMMCMGTPVLCSDEISTGLDAATTFDITRWMKHLTSAIDSIRIVSLLQPPPETVANFDEIILLSEGKIIFSGPIDRIIPYFNNLGYEIPHRMDLADWLQLLPTKEGWTQLKGASEAGANESEFTEKHLNTDAFHEKFYSSDLGISILERINMPSKDEGKQLFEERAKVKYVNPWYKTLKLLMDRELTIWWRNKYALKAKMIQTAVMGVIVGTVFFQSTGNPRNVLSLLFQSVLYTMVGSMVLVVRAFPDRSILYKQQDAEFFPTWAYVIGRSLSTIPVALIDAVGFGSLVFWFSGLAFNDGATAGNYFMFMLLLFVASLSSGLLLGLQAATCSVVNTAQAANALLVVILVLFSGFTVTPNVIPPYYIWIYWINFVAWLIRALIVNEFDSGKYSGPSQIPGLNEGQAILYQIGFVNADGEPFTYVWTWWGILFSIGTGLIALMFTSLAYDRIRYSTGKSLLTDQGSDIVEKVNEEDMIELPFKKVDLTFKGIRYTVESSITKEPLQLLQSVDGIVKAGQMTALMGSSGAGKTTLMDVIAQRKNTGEIEGEIRLNGHLQEGNSFKRCAGYVEQFDTQCPQLTIRETLMFSAKLRLEESDSGITDDVVDKFVSQTMKILELSNLQDLQVGDDETGGLSFEQRKRLSIAVELVANPSIIFLDEPTSGLDARAAAVVMRGMRRIASTGRAICATIHQPSITIFNDFDALLLLKRGGEVVFHGTLGKESSDLIKYLERFESTPRIQPGENPATWMLTTIGAGSSADAGTKAFDYAGSYAASKLHAHILEDIEIINASATDDNFVTFPNRYATSLRTQNMLVLKRMMKIYYRSPSYNFTRSVLACILALLFSTVYLAERVPTNEPQMNSRVNSVFVGVVFLCISSLNTVLKVFESERNMFYRHRAANMYTSRSVVMAFTLSEIPFLLMASTLFSVLFYFPMGFAIDAGKFFLFFLFSTLAMGTFTLIGQTLMSLFKDVQSAQGAGAIVSTATSLFSGVFISADEIPNFWIFMYWLLPGHWIFEGLFMSQFADDQSLIVASAGSPFYDALGCSTNPDQVCEGTISFWFQVNFTEFSSNNIPYDAIYLIGAILVTRCISLVALTKMNHLSN